MTETIAVVGAGSWGTALAVHLARTGHDVRLWARDAGFAAGMAAARENRTYLEGIALPDSMLVTASMADTVTNATIVLMAVPSHGMRTVAQVARPFLKSDVILVSATKGLEEGTMLRMSDVLLAEAGGAGAIVVLSGPSFARELARELPTALVVAGVVPAAVEMVQSQFRSSTLRLYGSADVVGVEIGGAFKNIIAIAAGVVEGLGLGHNALAALMTRGLAELSRLAVALGAQRETMAGLAGMGDLVLTCTGSLSRNRQVGIALANGESLESILSRSRMVAEGVRTTDTALALGRQLSVDLPIALEMAEVLAGRKSPQEVVRDLMGRRQKLERV